MSAVRSSVSSALKACVAATALMSATAASAATVSVSSGARVLYFEPFTTTIDPRPRLAQKQSNVRQMKFDAYGKRFELALEPNERLQNVATSGLSLSLYRGKLMGNTGSWARIAARGSDVHGLVWDGTDLYVIEPGEEVRDALVPPLDLGTVRTVLFRLSDTIVDSAGAFCSSAAPTKGDDAYDALLQELGSAKSSTRLQQAASAALQLQISAVGDAQFRAQFDSDDAARDAMLVRLNNVDGIFAEQFGVEIQVPTTLVYSNATDPLTTTTSPGDLLDKLATLRQNSTELRSAGLTHLFTGRDLDGLTVGIGYVDTLCRTKFGAALTEIRGRGAWLESLITAHEVGHNFGSVHDGEAQCSGIPQNQFIMSPTVLAANSTFSSCSRGLIQQALSQASCVASLPPADLAVPADLGNVRTGLGRTFEWEMSITNSGGRAAPSAHVALLVPPSLEVSDAWVSGGTCTSGAGAIECDLGEVAGGGSRAIHLELTGRTTGSNSITAQVMAAADADLLNNQGNGTITVDPELDLAVTLHAPAANIDSGSSFSASFMVTNTADIHATNMALTFALPANVSASAATIEGGTCTLNPATCTVSLLGPGASVSGTLQLFAASAGAGEISAKLSGTYFDPNQPNDVASQAITVIAPKAANTSSSSSGGGGGSLSYAFLLGLAGIGWARRWTGVSTGDFLRSQAQERESGRRA